MSYILTQWSGIYICIYYCFGFSSLSYIKIAILVALLVFLRNEITLPLVQAPVSPVFLVMGFSLELSINNKLIN